MIWCLQLLGRLGLSVAWAEASTTSEDKIPLIVICLMGQEVSEQRPVCPEAVPCYC